MNLKTVVTNYGIGDNSVLVVNRAILDGIVFSGLMARHGNLTYQGPSQTRNEYRSAGEYQAFCEAHGAPDVLIGQASYAADVFQWAREHTPKTVRILQRDSTHIRKWKELVDAEYERLGLDHRVGMGLVQHEEREYDLADAITVLSRWVERSFIEKGLADKVRYVGAQTIMLDRWNPAPRKLDGVDFRLMVAGQIRIAKGTHLILKAWRKLKPPSNWELLLSGVWPDNNLPPDEFALIAEEYEKTRRTANVKLGSWCPIEHMHERFAQCDVYCLPSIQEGSSMTCVEALACGRPLLASDRCGSDILEEHNGECGEIFDVHDEDHLIDAIRRYAKDPELRAKHGERGRDLAVEYGGMPRFGRDFSLAVQKIWHEKATR